MSVALSLVSLISLTLTRTGPVPPLLICQGASTQGAFNKRYEHFLPTKVLHYFADFCYTSIWLAVHAPNGQSQSDEGTSLKHNTKKRFLCFHNRSHSEYFLLPGPWVIAIILVLVKNVKIAGQQSGAGTRVQL